MTIRRFLKRFIRSEKGVASVEFVLVAPFYITVFLSSFELAMMNIRAVMLERATDIVVRDLRLGKVDEPSYDQVVNAICSLTFVVPDCDNTIRIEMRPVDPADWEPLGDDVECVRREEEIQPDVTFENGQQNNMMLLRVCAVFDPFYPTIGVGRSMPKEESGGYIVSASSAFVNEPD